MNLNNRPTNVHMKKDSMKNGSLILSWNPPQNQSFFTGVVIQKNGLDFLEVVKN